jgi:hypothetical protein
MQQEPTVLYGLGANRSGSSWLYNYLASHPDCYLRSVKELHYFSTKDPAKRKWWLRWFRSHLRDLQHARTQRSGKTPYLDQHVDDLRTLIHVVERHDDKLYKSYLSTRPANAKLVADITPAYAFIPAGLIRRMEQLFANTKFIFLIRDPLDRLWSNIRMAARHKLPEGGDFAKLCEHLAEKSLEDDNSKFIVRSDYRKTLRCLERSVPAANRHVEFFERLFHQDSVNRITDFLGISRLDADTGTVVHGGDVISLEGKLRKQLLEKLAPQYKFAHREFGEQLLTRWQTHLAEV